MFRFCDMYDGVCKLLLPYVVYLNVVYYFQPRVNDCLQNYEIDLTI